MSGFQEAMLLHIRANIEALVSEREAMVAANAWRMSCGDSIAYNEDAFAMNASALRAMLPDPRAFE